MALIPSVCCWAGYGCLRQAAIGQERTFGIAIPIRTSALTNWASDASRRKALTTDRRTVR